MYDHVEHLKCSHVGCEEVLEYPNGYWKRVKLTKTADSWFLQKNGDSWCPKHFPKWYKDWKDTKNK